MSPAGGGRIYNEEKYLKGGGLSLEIYIHPYLENVLYRSTSPPAGDNDQLKFYLA